MRSTDPFHLGHKRAPSGLFFERPHPEPAVRGLSGHPAALHGPGDLWRLPGAHALRLVKRAIGLLHGLEPPYHAAGRLLRRASRACLGAAGQGGVLWEAGGAHDHRAGPRESCRAPENQLEPESRGEL